MYDIASLHLGLDDQNGLWLLAGPVPGAGAGAGPEDADAPPVRLGDLDWDPAWPAWLGPAPDWFGAEKEWLRGERRWQRAYRAGCRAAEDAAWRLAKGA